MHLLTGFIKALITQIWVLTKVSADLLLIQRVQLIFVKTHYIVNQMSGRRLFRQFLRITQHSTTACIRKDISQTSYEKNIIET